jgi:hypothetical protein
MTPTNVFEDSVGKRESLVQFGMPMLGTTGAYYTFPTPQLQAIRDHGSIPVLAWSTMKSGDYSNPDTTLRAINAGRHDDGIRAFAQAAAAWGKPFFLRFNWEMNGDWFPWAENANGNKPGDYVAAWRHVHNLFARAGATNATWVWCPHAATTPRLGPLARYYPGNRYVDWTCLDGFNWGKNRINPRPWASFDEIFASSYDTIVNELAPSKPMLLGEMASGGRAHAKATWIDQMFEVLRSKYRRIRGLIWFEQIDRGVRWPIETAPAVTDAFSRGIGQPGFKANAYSTLGGPKVMPPIDPAQPVPRNP